MTVISDDATLAPADSETFPETVGKMRLLDTPAHCASCYLQETDVRHVDFGASYDGPVLEGSIKVTIDDLVLCENCLRTAVQLLGITGDVEELQDELRLANQEKLELRERVNGLEDYRRKLEAAVSAKEDLPT